MKLSWITAISEQIEDVKEARQLLSRLFHPANSCKHDEEDVPLTMIAEEIIGFMDMLQRTIHEKDAMIQVLQDLQATPAEVTSAFKYVSSFAPEVRYVIYDKDLRWRFVDTDFKPVHFPIHVNMTILEDAADSVNGIPRIYMHNPSEPTTE